MLNYKTHIFTTFTRDAMAEWLRRLNSFEFLDGNVASGSCQRFGTTVRENDIELVFV